MRGDFDEDEQDAPAVDEPTVMLAASAYARAYRLRLALKRRGRCIRERAYNEAPCWQLTLDDDEICAHCKERDEAAYLSARLKLANTKRRLLRALGVYEAHAERRREL